MEYRRRPFQIEVCAQRLRNPPRRRHTRRAKRRSCDRTRHPRRDRSHSSHRRFDAHGLQPTRPRPGAERRLGRTTRLGRPGKASTHVSDGLRAPRRRRSRRYRTIARRFSVIHEPNRALRQHRFDLAADALIDLGETSGVPPTDNCAIGDRRSSLSPPAPSATCHCDELACGAALECARHLRRTR